MTSLPHPSRASSRWANSAIVLELLLALGALGGGAALMAGPRGEIIPLPVSALSGSPFADYFIPGAVLFTALGVGPLAAALLAQRRHRVAPLATVLVGLTLVVWLGVEIAIVGYSNDPPLQAIYLVLGLVIVTLGTAWMLRARHADAPHA